MEGTSWQPLMCAYVEDLHITVALLDNEMECDCWTDDAPTGYDSDDSCE
jgi:hypothetical protein